MNYNLPIDDFDDIYFNQNLDEVTVTPNVEEVEVEDKETATTISLTIIKYVLLKYWWVVFGIVLLMIKKRR
jgi:hypothetical protein